MVKEKVFDCGKETWWLLRRVDVIRKCMGARVSRIHSFGSLGDLILYHPSCTSLSDVHGIFSPCHLGASVCSFGPAFSQLLLSARTALALS